MKKSYDIIQPFIAQCYHILKKPYSKVDETTLRNDLSLIDKYLEVVSDVLLECGLQDNWEPNIFGFQLEEVMGYLLELRYSIVG